MLDKRLFGVSTHLPKISEKLIYKETALLVKAGINSVRIGFLWSDIEPQKGQYDWKKLDMVVKILNNANIDILGTLARTPDWANGGNECGSFRFHPPADLTDYSNFVAETVSHFKGKVNNWEIWNEPNSNNFWYPKADVNRYVGMLKKAYIAAKEAVPECLVMHGGIMCCREHRVDFEYLEQFFKSGGAEYTDVINVHPYSGPNPPERDFHKTMKRLKQMMSVYNCVHKKIWFTEIGTPLHERFALSDEEQACHVTRHFLCAIAYPKIERLFWYDFRNDGNDVECFEHHFGLVDNDYKTKKAYHAYAFSADKLADSTFVNVAEHKDGGKIYIFEKGSKVFSVVWAKECHSLLLRNIDYELTACNLIGEAVKVIYKKNSVDLTLAPVPLYFTMDKLNGEKFLNSFLNSKTLIGI